MNFFNVLIISILQNMCYGDPELTLLSSISLNSNLLVATNSDASKTIVGSEYLYTLYDTSDKTNPQFLSEVANSAASSVHA